MRNRVTFAIVGLAWLFVLGGCASDTPYVDVSGDPSAPSNFRRVRLAMDEAGAYRSRGVLAFNSLSDETPTSIVISSNPDRVRFELLPDQPGEIVDGAVRGRVSRTQGLGLYVIPVSVGAPEEPAARIRVESRHGAQSIEVWVEPTRGRWRTANPDLGIVPVDAGGVGCGLCG